MVKSVLNFLNKNYPFFYGQRTVNFFIALFAGGTVVHCIILTRPELIIANIETSYSAACFSYAFITFSCIMVWSEFLIKFVEKTKKWKVYNEVISTVTCIACMGFLNYFYIYFFGKLQFNSISFDAFFMIKIVLTTMLSGVVPLSIISLFNFLRRENQLKKSYKRDIENKIEESKPNELLVVEEGNEIFNLNLMNVSLVESMGNYVKIYQNKTHQALIKRITMKRMEELLKDQNILVRVHRSYFINLSHIERIHKSSSGDVSLVCKHTNTHIPVSRSKKKELQAMLQLEEVSF